MRSFLSVKLKKPIILLIPQPDNQTSCCKTDAAEVTRAEQGYITLKLN